MGTTAGMNKLLALAIIVVVCPRDRSNIYLLALSEIRSVIKVRS